MKRTLKSLFRKSFPTKYQSIYITFLIVKCPTLELVTTVLVLG